MCDPWWHCQTRPTEALVSASTGGRRASPTSHLAPTCTLRLQLFHHNTQHNQSLHHQTSKTMSPQHTYFYKILPSAPPTPLPETLPLSDLDKKDGFIHLSTAAQTPKTMDLFFGECEKLWVLKLRVRDLDGEVRWEESLPGCPHLHGSERGLGRGNVEGVVVVERKGGGDWKGVLEGRGLED